MDTDRATDKQYAAKSRGFNHLRLILCEQSLKNLKPGDTRANPIHVSAGFSKETFKTILPLPTQNKQLFYYNIPFMNNSFAISCQDEKLLIRYVSKTGSIVHSYKREIISKIMETAVESLTLAIVPNYKDLIPYCIGYLEASNKLSHARANYDSARYRVINAEEVVCKLDNERTKVKNTYPQDTKEQIINKINKLKELEAQITAGKTSVKHAKTKEEIASIDLKIGLKTQISFTRKFEEYCAEHPKTQSLDAVAKKLSCIQSYIVIHECNID